jgi:CO/xanthine dehydrogenase Mo-binding subunit
MLFAKALRSTRAHARIASLDADEARRMPGVHAVLTHAEIAPHLMPVYGYFIKDQPIVAVDRVRYIGDIICAVAAETEAIAAAALARIRVVYEDLPTIASIEAAIAPGAAELFPQAPVGIVPAYGTGASASLRPAPNICYQFNYTTGSSAAFASCDHVFEDEFRFSRMHHFHLEPFVTVAEAGSARIEVWTACQNPFPLRKELARIFKIAENRIAVHVAYLGGGFGSKNNCKTEPIAVMLSMLTGRPVRFCLTMEESALTNTQHAAILRLRTGVMSDGRLVARSSDIWLDAGAYSDASPLVAEKAGYRIPGPYRWEHIDTRCYCVMTNTAPAGPFRGFGGTQTTWASESQIDMIARRLKIDPYELRSRNLLALGEPFVPGESGIDSDLVAGLERVASEIGWFEPGRRGRGATWAAAEGGGAAATQEAIGNARSAEPIGQRVRGIGLSIGFKDGGGVNKPAQARIKVSTGGDIYLHCGTVEIGQGARSALAAITAEILRAPIDRICLPEINTDYLPFDQGTNASSAIAVMGQAVAQAAQSVRDQVLAFAADQLGCPPAELALVDWTIERANQRVPLAPLIMRHFGGTGFEFTGEGYHKAPSDHGAPLEAPCVFWEIGWGAAEVEIDTGTGQIRVVKLVASGDTGRSINPLVCRGQEEGAAIMGLGQALFERMIHDDQARLINLDPLIYRVPLAEDLPTEFLSITQEQGYGPGPFGSKGAGEATILPIASAIANAIDDALGIRITSLPITPEKVLSALSQRGSAHFYHDTHGDTQ